MPSPIAHTAMGYLIYRLSRHRLPEQTRKKIGPLPLLMAVAMGVSLLPDLDSIAGILAGDFGRYHNNGTHSLLVGLAVSLLVAGVLWFVKRYDFVLWFVVLLASYEMHVIMDYFTVGGRGVMLFWPLTLQRFESPVKLFFGVRWSESPLDPVHLVTLANELVFLFLVVLFAHLWERKTLINRNKKAANTF